MVGHQPRKHQYALFSHQVDSSIQQASQWVIHPQGQPLFYNINLASLRVLHLVFFHCPTHESISKSLFSLLINLEWYSLHQWPSTSTTCYCNYPTTIVFSWACVDPFHGQNNPYLFINFSLFLLVVGAQRMPRPVLFFLIKFIAQSAQLKPLSQPMINI